MLKITIHVQDKDDKSCTIKLINPKDLSKGSTSERNVCASLINEISNLLANLENKKIN